MERILLYYPAMDIDSEVLKQNILYWDKISSIVPENWKNMDNFKINPDILFLEQQKIYVPSFQSEIYNQNGLYNKFFDDLKTSLETLKNQKVNRFQMISREKFTESMLIYFIENKFIDEKNSNENFIRVSLEVSNKLFTLLSQYIAISKDENISTGTNHPEYHNILFNENSEGKLMLTTSLYSLLPTPTNNNSLEDLLFFKKKNIDLLNNLRKRIDSEVDALSKAESIRDIKAKINIFKESINKELNEINVIFREAEIKTIYKSILSVFEVKAPTLAATGSFFASKFFDLLNSPISEELVLNWIFTGNNKIRRYIL